MPPGTSEGTDRAFHGTILGSGVTCVPFTGVDGKRYALSGPGVTKRVRTLARSGFGRKTLHSSPSQRMIATVTVVGHIEPHAMNTCGYATLVASKVTVESARAYTGSPPEVGT